MKVFLSHASKDNALAHALANRLTQEGFSVWLADDEIAPGDNWAKKIGKALDEAELMVLLLTHAAMKSDSLRQNLEYALGARKYEGRFFSVIVGPTKKAGKDVPWILLRLPHCQVESAEQFGEVVKEIQALVAQNDMSHANA
jgi:TIR domain